MLLAALLMNFILYFAYSVFILHEPFSHTLEIFLTTPNSAFWLLRHSLGWVLIFIATQLAIEFYEKYSPGVFWQILIGRYIRSKTERRIVLFLDLVDSTPIAEQLDSQKNFGFIRDFIYFVSLAFLEYDGRIYQYVGDEIVVSWVHKPKNIIKCLNAVALASRLLQKNKAYFKKRYGFIPEFNVGIHSGELSVGEIGVVKKDIAMSGDTMNTAARIRDYSKKIKTNCVLSKDFLDGTNVKWRMKSLGPVDLKGKSEEIELLTLNV
jgi:adenylate cyclase